MDIWIINWKKMQNSWTSGKSREIPVLIGKARKSIPINHILKGIVKVSSNFFSSKSKKDQKFSGLFCLSY